MVKPIVKLVGKDGNIFNSLGLAKKALCMHLPIVFSSFMQGIMTDTRGVVIAS